MRGESTRRRDGRNGRNGADVEHAKRWHAVPAGLAHVHDPLTADRDEDAEPGVVLRDGYYLGRCLVLLGAAYGLDTRLGVDARVACRELMPAARRMDGLRVVRDGGMSAGAAPGESVYEAPVRSGNKRWKVARIKKRVRKR